MASASGLWKLICQPTRRGPRVAGLKKFDAECFNLVQQRRTQNLRRTRRLVGNRATRRSLALISWRRGTARMSIAHLRTTRASFPMTNGSNLCQPDKRIRRRRRRRDTSSKWAAAAGVGCLIRTRSSRTAMVLTRSTPSPAAPTRIYNKDPRRSGSRRAVSTAWVQLFAASRPDTAKQATSAARVQKRATAGSGREYATTASLHFSKQLVECAPTSGRQLSALHAPIANCKRAVAYVLPTLILTVQGSGEGLAANTLTADSHGGAKDCPTAVVMLQGLGGQTTRNCWRSCSHLQLV